MMLLRIALILVLSTSLFAATPLEKDACSQVEIILKKSKIFQKYLMTLNNSDGVNDQVIKVSGINEKQVCRVSAGPTYFSPRSIGPIEMSFTVFSEHSGKTFAPMYLVRENVKVYCGRMATYSCTLYRSLANGQTSRECKGKFHDEIMKLMGLNSKTAKKCNVLTLE